MQKTKGFTLIELLVIVSITVLMTVVVFSNYGKNNEIFALERSSQKLAQDLRRTQEMAMSGLEGDASTAGYGMYFNNTAGNQSQYLIYMENNTNMYYESGTDDIKETINLESGIQICDIKDNTSSANYLSISFEPPNPLTYVGGNPSGHEASIVICMTSDNSQTRTIKVNNVGRVEVTNP
jgi:type II secretory pathway pseudopilin PulG